mmetsp:Transcript_3405/g.8113  ORF Transcript_3405/g.8113 Transcript_3405/m.8113 type:complete len:313 (+) Transcript_3405:2172-3110(+)
MAVVADGGGLARVAAGGGGVARVAAGGGGAVRVAAGDGDCEERAGCPGVWKSCVGDRLLALMMDPGAPYSGVIVVCVPGYLRSITWGSGFRRGESSLSMRWIGPLIVSGGLAKQSVLCISLGRFAMVCLSSRLSSGDRAFSVFSALFNTLSLSSARRRRSSSGLGVLAASSAAMRSISIRRVSSARRRRSSSGLRLFTSSSALIRSNSICRFCSARRRRSSSGLRLFAASSPLIRSNSIRLSSARRWRNASGVKVTTLGSDWFVVNAFAVRCCQEIGLTAPGDSCMVEGLLANGSYPPLESLGSIPFGLRVL